MIMLQNFSVTCLLFLIYLVVVEATDTITGPIDQNDRKGRAWHHSHPGPQMLLQQHQQAPVSTSQPNDLPLQQSPNQHQPNDPNGLNRNYEEQDKSVVPAASEHDFLSRHFGYLNVHQFDPNFPYYDRQVYPRFPSPQLSQNAPRFGPGYRKDKYGHGYGYSCKQGDDCDEVRAANQLAAAQPPPHLTHPHPHNHGLPFGSNYPELPPFPSIPSFSSMSSFAPYAGQFGSAPARFNDPQGQSMMSSMYPSRFYQGRYLHDDESSARGLPANNDKGVSTMNQKQGSPNSNYNEVPNINTLKGVQNGNNYKNSPLNNKHQDKQEDSQRIIDDIKFN